MERASRVLRKVSFPKDSITPEDLACGAWAPSVGKKIAPHTRATRLVRSCLVVEVEDAVWQRQLFSLTRQIVASLTERLGPGIVDDIEFRVAPPRRGPQRAAEIAARPPQDEATQISDPVLRNIYRNAKKRALA